MVESNSRRHAAPTLLGAALALCLAGASLPAAADFTPGDHIDETLVHDGTSRFYDLHVPASYTGAAPVPLVVDAHGLTSSKTAQRGYSNFTTVSELEGFIVALPQGLWGDPLDDEVAYPPAATLATAEGPSWNAGDLCCGRALAEDTDDVGFVRAMVAAISAEANIDPARIYVTGLSNGGFLTHRLACEAADLFAAAAPVAAPLGSDPLTNCSPSRPIPILAFQGVTDVVVPYGGGHIAGDPGLPVLPAAQASFEYWRNTNGCTGLAPDVDEDIGLGNSCEFYDQCDAGVQTGLCSVTGIDFAPPNDFVNGHLLYYNGNTIDVATRAWAFMSQFTLPSTPQPVPGLGLLGRLGVAAGIAGVVALRSRRRRRS